MDFVKLASHEVPAFNETFLEHISSGNIKEAQVSANSFTRNKLRDDSFAEKILTPIDISNDELDKAEDPELLVKWNDREPDTSPATDVPLGTTGEGLEFYGDRYPSYFSRIMSPWYHKEIDKLRGFQYDIRQIMLEISTKEIAKSVDTRFLNRINAVIGSVNTANPLNGMGLPQNIALSGGITRENLAEAFAAIQRLQVPFGPLQPDGGESKGCMLMNTVTATELLKLGPSEIGWDTAQETFVNGLPTKTLFGVKPIYTLKRDLVPDNTIYFFSSEEFLGKYYRLQPLTVFMENKAFFLSFFQYMNISMAIGNVRGAIKVAFEA